MHMENQQQLPKTLSKAINLKRQRNLNTTKTNLPTTRRIWICSVFNSFIHLLNHPLILLIEVTYIFLEFKSTPILFLQSSSYPKYFCSIRQKLGPLLLMFTLTLPGFLDSGHKHFQSLTRWHEKKFNWSTSIKRLFFYKVSQYKVSKIPSRQNTFCVQNI